MCLQFDPHVSIKPTRRSVSATTFTPRFSLFPVEARIFTRLEPSVHPGQRGRGSREGCGRKRRQKDGKCVAQRGVRAAAMPVSCLLSGSTPDPRGLLRPSRTPRRNIGGTCRCEWPGPELLPPPVLVSYLLSYALSATSEPRVLTHTERLRTSRGRTSHPPAGGARVLGASRPESHPGGGGGGSS